MPYDSSKAIDFPNSSLIYYRRKVLFDETFPGEQWLTKLSPTLVRVRNDGDLFISLHALHCQCINVFLLY